MALIRVGAATEIEMKEKKARVEDALHATRAAVEEGVVPAAALRYPRARSRLKDLKGANRDQDGGIQIVLRALEEPLRADRRQQRRRAFRGPQQGGRGQGQLRLQRARPASSATWSQQGVIDPTKVVRFALQNAASVAGLMLTTAAMVAERVEEDKSSGGQGGMPGMGGMGGMGM